MIMQQAEYRPDEEPLAARSPQRFNKSLLLDRFCRNFAPAVGLSVQECRTMLSSDQAVLVPAGRTLAVAGMPIKPKVILSGWACLQQILENGRRQIFSFQVPRDMLGMGGTGSSFANVVALTPMVLVDASALDRASKNSLAHTQLRNALGDMELRQASYIYRQIVRLGCHGAYDGLRDLLHELFERLVRAGLACNDGVPFPLTQEVLGDALGLSSVHVNRTMQQMRRSGALELEHGRLTLRGHA